MIRSLYQFPTGRFFIASEKMKKRGFESFYDGLKRRRKSNFFEKIEKFFAKKKGF